MSDYILGRCPTCGSYGKRKVSSCSKCVKELNKDKPVLDCNKCDSLGKKLERCGPGTGVRC